MLFNEENMTKLFTLGCSLTFPHGWKDILAHKIGSELVNSAIYAGSNNLQVKRIHNYIVHDQISKDDIIVWQITSKMRSSFSVAMCDFWYETLNNFSKNPDPAWANCQYYIDSPANYFDKTQHVDVLSNHPLVSKASSYYDSAQSMEELLSTIILLNKTYKVLIFVGWPGALDEDYSSYNRFIDALAAHNVPHLPESMLEWVIRTDHDLDEEDPAGLHPTMESSEAYADQVLYPKLQDLGWTDV